MKQLYISGNENATSNLKYKITLLTSLIISTICFFSCSDDVLDVQSPDKLTSKNFWRNQTDAEAGLSAVYSQLENAIDVWEFAEVKYPVEAYREDLCEIGADALNYPTWVELYNFSYTNGNSQFSTYWENHYRGILYANEVLEKVQGINMDESYKKQILAEARFLRAYYHMKLILNWEKMIIRDKYITSQDELDKPLSERTDCWNFIITDLEQCIDGLPQKQSAEHTGRAVKGAAYAYLGYCYLTRAYEEDGNKSQYLNKAESALKSVTGFSLVKNFTSMFDGTNKNSPESIFELQFTETTANGASYRTAIHKWIAVDELSGWDEILPSQMLVNEFKKEGMIATTGGYDSRIYQTIFFNDPYFNDPDAKRVYGYTYNELFGADSNKPAFRKYLPATAADLAKSRTAVNIPLMRYANVLLLLAETLNEQGKTGEAISLINQVRARADMPAISESSDQNSVRSQIEHERILEFSLEDSRFYDLRRWGKTKSALDAIGRTSFNPEKNNFYPVPLIEIKSNGALN